MAWDSNANSLFPHTVTLGSPGAKTLYGRAAAPTAVNTVTYSALIEHKTRMVRGIDGREVMSSIAVYLSGAGGVSGLTTEWVLTLPDGTSRPILSVSRFADEGGDVLEVAYLQ